MIIIPVVNVVYCVKLTPVSLNDSFAFEMYETCDSSGFVVQIADTAVISECQ